MAGMFMTISRCNVKAGSEKEARKLLEKEMLPGDGKKPGDVVEGLVGFGLMKAKKDAHMYGVVTVWESEAAFDKMSSNPRAKDGGGLVGKLQKLCDGKIKGEGFYIESL
jgi:heme-degrading monooxygenase HmoA